jgi:hypothetical protein
MSKLLKAFREIVTPSTLLAATVVTIAAGICNFVLLTNPIIWRPIAFVLWGLIMAYYGFLFIVLPVILYRRNKQQRNSQD